MKERFQNPNVNDTVRLRLWVYNAHNFADVRSIDRVDIYKIDDLDPRDVSARRLVESIDGANVSQDSTGKYYLDVELTDPTYIVGKYVDVWYASFEPQEEDENILAPIENVFEIYRDQWFTTPTPLVYDFSFNFRPNRFIKGTKQYIIVNITPNVPRASALDTYYTALAVTSPLRISISQKCGPCVPQEEDLRLVVDNELVEIREKNVGYYFFDTSELDEGIYDVWFQMEFGESVFISPKNQLQIHK